MPSGKVKTINPEWVGCIGGGHWIIEPGGIARMTETTNAKHHSDTVRQAVKALNAAMADAAEEGIKIDLRVEEVDSRPNIVAECWAKV